MQNKKWSKKYDACIKCNKAERRHSWRWLCSKCYDKKRWEKEARKEQLKRGYEKNREWRQIKRKVRRRTGKGYSNMKMIIDWQEVDLPFETLKKPLFSKKKEYKKRKKNNDIFEKIKLLFNKKNYGK